MKRKRGDTLIEVALAIGIFSLVAIVIVSVVSASTSGAQSSLELTLTREELDAQAEALRFIHDSYISGSQSKDTTENKYADLWNTITTKTVEEPETDDRKKEILDYNPEVCANIYDGAGHVRNLASSNSPIPFIINIRNIGNVNSQKPGTNGMTNAVNDIVIANDSTSVFKAPQTYPRILYGNVASDQSLQAEAEDVNTKIQLVEGIYIIGVKGKSQIVDGSSPNNAISKSAYYDFYIRSCWMPIGSDRASTISTVIRLYDPAVITY